MSQGISIRPFQKDDSDKVKEFISDIIVNEFKFKLEFDTLDYDILAIDESYNKYNGRCFWVAETVVNDDYSNAPNKNKKYYTLPSSICFRRAGDYELYIISICLSVSAIA